MAQKDGFVSGVAGRYATALFELAREARAIDAVGNDLARFDALIDESPDLDRFVRSPVFTAEEQAGALGAILEQAGIGGLAANFLRLVATKRRLFAVRDMIRGYRARVDEARGVQQAEVTVAEPPSDALREEIRAALKASASGEVSLDVKVDPSIIGGLKVRLGSRMVDASLRTKLNGIRLAMRETP